MSNFGWVFKKILIFENFDVLWYVGKSGDLLGLELWELKGNFFGVNKKYCKKKISEIG